MTALQSSSDLSSLIATPLIGLEHAGFSAAQAFLDVVREFGFAGANGNDWGSFRYVSIVLRRAHSPDASDLVVEIPLLSLIPLPMVEVRAAELEFDVSLLGFIECEEKASFDLELGAPQRNGTRVLPALHAAFASAGSRDPLMHIKLNVAPSAFPSGITTLLHLMKEAAHGSPKESA
jgi:Protein of unknown function (DUF2589)